MPKYDLQLRRGGILVSKEWNSDENDFIEEIVEDDNLLFYLYDTICIDSGVTLKDLFKLMERDTLIFSAATMCPFLEDILEEGFTDFCGEKTQDIGFLEVKRNARIYEDDEGIRYFDKSLDFFGISNDKEIALEFTPSNELMSYPLFLNEGVKITDKEGNIVFEYNEKFILSELVFAIVSALSFVGHPENREEGFQEIKGVLEEFDSFEDYEESFNSVEFNKNYKKPCKICGGDSRSPHFNKPKDICIKCFKKMKEN